MSPHVPYSTYIHTFASSRSCAKNAFSLPSFQSLISSFFHSSFIYSCECTLSTCFCQAQEPRGNEWDVAETLGQTRQKQDDTSLFWCPCITHFSTQNILTPSGPKSRWVPSPTSTKFPSVLPLSLNLKTRNIQKMTLASQFGDIILST